MTNQIAAFTLTRQLHPSLSLIKINLFYHFGINVFWEVRCICCQKKGLSKVLAQICSLICPDFQGPPPRGKTRLQLRILITTVENLIPFYEFSKSSMGSGKKTLIWPISVWRTVSQNYYFLLLRFWPVGNSKIDIYFDSKSRSGARGHFSKIQKIISAFFLVNLCFRPLRIRISA